MADAGQAPAAATEGQTPTVPIVPVAVVPVGPQAEPSTYDAEYVKQLRSEAAASRTKLRSYKKAEEDRKTAEMGDLERAQTRAKAAEERVSAMERNAAKRDAISALEKANVIDADLAYGALESKIEIKDGEAINIEGLVAEFVKARPQMVKSATPNAPTLPETHSLNPPATPSIPVRGRPAGRL